MAAAPERLAPEQALIAAYRQVDIQHRDGHVIQLAEHGGSLRAEAPPCSA
jgi:hypothetical protein